MKLEFDEATMPDELYNTLLQHFVNQAIAQGLPVSKHTKFENWVVKCELKDAAH